MSPKSDHRIEFAFRRTATLEASQMPLIAEKVRSQSMPTIRDFSSVTPAGVTRGRFNNPVVALRRPPATLFDVSGVANPGLKSWAIAQSSLRGPPIRGRDRV